MSSTGNSNTPFRWFEAISLKAPKPAVTLPPEPDPWETVDFPDRVAVAAIPREPIASNTPVAPRPDAATVAEPISLRSDETADAVKGAMPPQSLPNLTPLAPLVADLDPMTSEPINAQPPALVEAELGPENAQLRQQLAELEGALTRSQTVLRAETERWQAKTLAQSAQEAQRWQRQSVQVAQQGQTLIDSQAKIAEQAQALQALREQNALQTQELLAVNQQLAQLMPELEQTTQTAQRQQILVETLTVQLNASQEQVAQLERECSLQQQRYAEQMQLTLQLESAGKDLRSRLSRQQRYTLQFKAALEKCLEVPAAQGFAHLALSQHPEGELVEATASAPVFIPKAQPVQPWSAQPGFLTALQAPLADIEWSESDGEVELAAPPAPAVSPPQSLTDRIAPRITSGRTISALELPQMLTSAPLLAEPEMAEPEAELAAAEVDSEASVEPLAQENLAEVDLWAAASADRLKDEELTAGELTGDVTEAIAADREAEDASQPSSTDDNWLNRFKRSTELTAAEAIAPAADLPADRSGSKPLPVLNLVANSRSEKSIHSAQRLSPFITLADELPEVAESQPEPETLPLFYTGGPSPLIYPLRPAKKIPSLAAVQLPSFPRSGR